MFEGFRVRSLEAINTLNHIITYAIGFLAVMSAKHDTSMLRQAIIPEHVHLRNGLCFYSIGLVWVYCVY